MTEPSEAELILAQQKEAARELRGLIKDAGVAVAQLREAVAEAQVAAAGQVKAFEESYSTEANKAIDRVWKDVSRVIDGAEKRIIGKFDALMRMLTTPPKNIRDALGITTVDELVAMRADPDFAVSVAMADEQEVRRLPKAKGRRRR